MSAKSIGAVLVLAILAVGLWAGEGRGQTGRAYGLVKGSLHCLAAGTAVGPCPRDMEQCEREGRRHVVTEPFQAFTVGWPGRSSYGPAPYFSVRADKETLTALCARMNGHEVKATGIVYPATRSFWIINLGQ